MNDLLLYKPTKGFTKRFSKTLAVKIDEDLQLLIEFLCRSIIFRSMAVHSSTVLNIFGCCWKTCQCTSYISSSYLTRWSGPVLRKCSIPILAEKPAILTEGFLDRRQFLRANSEIESLLGHNCFFPNSFENLSSDTA
jgi:hypothetical protein